MLSFSIFTAFMIGFMITGIVGASFFLAVVMWTFGNIMIQELATIIKEERAEPRLTRAQRRMQELEWEAFLEDLKVDHYKQPINVFRDGVSIV